MKKKRPTQFRRRRSKRKGRQTRHWRGTELWVAYKFKGFVDGKDAAIRKALGKYETGSGYAFATHERDHTATVPEDDLAHVLGELKKISGIKTKKRVTKWVLCR